MKSKLKKMFVVLLAFVMVAGIFPPFTHTAEASTEILVSTTTQLRNAIASGPSGRVIRLTQDISRTEMDGNWIPILISNEANGTFTLEGDGHILTVQINGLERNNTGLIGRLNAGANAQITIRNFGVHIDEFIRSRRTGSGHQSLEVGAFFGWVQSGNVTIENSFVRGNVEAYRPYASGTGISSETYAGGFIGFLSAGNNVTIRNSFFHGNVRSVAYARGLRNHAISYAAGLVGRRPGGAGSLNIINSYAAGTVFSRARGTGVSANGDSDGGILMNGGSAGLTITNSVSSVALTLEGSRSNNRGVSGSIVSEALLRYRGANAQLNSWNWNTIWEYRGAQVDSGNISANNGFPVLRVFYRVRSVTLSPSTSVTLGTAAGSNTQAYTATVFPERARLPASRERGFAINGTRPSVSWAVRDGTTNVGSAIATIAPQSGQVNAAGQSSATVTALAGSPRTLNVRASFGTVEAQAPLTIRSVTVGAQSGNLIAGTAGTVTFPVTTSHIPNGNHTATVANLPAGVTVQGNVRITNGAGTLTLAGNASTLGSVTNNLALTISQTRSPNFSLNIFGPVTEITGVTTTDMTAVQTRTMTGTVQPANATNRTPIVWSIQSAGTTGATFTGANNNVLTPTAAGTVTIRATIANGRLPGTAFTQDFTITVNRAAGATVNQLPRSLTATYDTVTVGAAATLNTTSPAHGQSVEYAISRFNAAGTGANQFNAATANWQSGLTFTGLLPNTQYFVWARSAQTGRRNAGTPRVSAGITTRRAPGAAIATPATANDVRHNSISVHPATLATTTGQNIQYAISTSGTAAPTSGWQTGLHFTGLSAQTTYFVWARSLQNSTYATGTPRASAAIITSNPPPGVGAAISSVPTMNTRTHYSITVNPATLATTTGQTIEYAINQSNEDIPATGWQEGLTFDGLEPETTYNVWARSAANDTHAAGTALVSEDIQTLPVPTFRTTIDGGGTDAEATPQYAREGETVQLYAGERTGFEFANWTSGYADIQNENSAEVAYFVMGTADVTVTANWARIYHTVTFDPQGGTFENHDDDQRDVPHGDTVDTLPEITRRAGYDFTGWFLEPEGGIEWDSMAPVTDDQTLFAQWTQYRIVNFNPAPTGGTLSADLGGAFQRGAQANIGETVTFTAAHSPGYRLYEWTAEGADLGGEATALTRTLDIPPADGGDVEITVNAVLAPVYHELTATDFGYGGTQSGPVRVDSTVTLLPGTRDGYRLEGWTVNAGGVTPVGNVFTMPNQPVEIAAGWYGLSLTVDPYEIFISDAVLSGSATISGNALGDISLYYDAPDGITISRTENEITVTATAHPTNAPAVYDAFTILVVREGVHAPLTVNVSFASTVVYDCDACSDEGCELCVPEITITTQPQSPAAPVSLGEPLTLTVEASATLDAVPTFQWYRATDAEAEDFEPIPGANEATLAVTTSAVGVAHYAVLVSATGAAPQVSDIATVTVAVTTAPITNRTIGGISRPVAGESAGTPQDCPDGQWTVENLGWEYYNDGGWEWVTLPHTFQHGTVYRLLLTIDAGDGWHFPDGFTFESIGGIRPRIDNHAFNFRDIRFPFSATAPAPATYPVTADPAVATYISVYPATAAVGAEITVTITPPTGQMLSANGITATGVTAFTGNTANSTQVTFTKTAGETIVNAAFEYTPQTIANAAIAAAFTAVENANFSAVAQAAINTQPAAVSHVTDIIAALALTGGVSTTVNVVSFTAATAGTAATPYGICGALIFTVTVDHANGTAQTTGLHTLAINATEYVPNICGENGYECRLPDCPLCYPPHCCADYPDCNCDDDPQPCCADYPDCNCDDDPQPCCADYPDCNCDDDPQPCCADYPDCNCGDDPQPCCTDYPDCNCDDDPQPCYADYPDCNCDDPTEFFAITMIGYGAGAFATPSPAALGMEVTIYAGARGGYTFGGWTSSPAALAFTSPAAIQTTFTMPAEAVTVTANWQRIPVYACTHCNDSGDYCDHCNPQPIPVPLHLQGGAFTTTPPAISITSGSAIGKLPTMPTEATPNGIAKEGYRFTGWFAYVDGVFTRIRDDFIVPHRIELVATWIPKPENFRVGSTTTNNHVTSADATRIARWLAGHEPDDFCILAADINGDGEVTADDLILLARWLAGHDVRHFIAQTVI